MTIQTINIGNLVNDGLGDDLRTAFQKVNGNFSDLSAQLTLTAENFGNGSKIFKRKTGSNLEFRTIISGGAGIAIQELEDVIAISNDAPKGFRRVTSNSGFISADAETELVFDGIGNIDINIIGPRITFDTIKINNRSYKDILSSFDFGYVDGLFDNAVQFAVANSIVNFGTVETPSEINFDLGGAQGSQRL